jgi:DnaJ family protein C protein 7
MILFENMLPFPGNRVIHKGTILCVQLLALRSEALLRLHKLEEADSTITSLLKLDNASLPSTPTKVSGMSADSYVHIVQAQVNMAFGRYKY